MLYLPSHARLTGKVGRIGRRATKDMTAKSSGIFYLCAPQNHVVRLRFHSCKATGVLIGSLCLTKRVSVKCQSLLPTDKLKSARMPIQTYIIQLYSGAIHEANFIFYNNATRGGKTRRNSYSLSRVRPSFTIKAPQGV